MPYSEIINTAFRTLWRQKPLWLFGLLGTLLPALGAGIYLGSMFVWQESFMRHLMALTSTQQLDYLTVMRVLTVGLRGLAGAWGVLACVGLIGYFVNLIMRAATASEAGRALAGESSQSERGLAIGVRRAVSFFVIDLLWWLPAIVVSICGVVFAIAALGGFLSRANTQDAEAMMGEVVGVFVVVFSSIGCLGLLWLLYAIARSLLAPLMYQAAAQESFGVGQAVRQGARLARAHLGPMLIFLIFLTGLGMVLSFTLQLFTTPFSGVWAMNWAGMAEDMANGMPPAPPSAFGRTAFYGLGLLFGLATWLSSAFVQTFGLTLYAEVYRRLRPPAQANEPA